MGKYLIFKYLKDYFLILNKYYPNKKFKKASFFSK
jgi:hypothetical protein